MLKINKMYKLNKIIFIFANIILYFERNELLNKYKLLRC